MQNYEKQTKQKLSSRLLLTTSTLKKNFARLNKIYMLSSEAMSDM